MPHAKDNGGTGCSYDDVTTVLNEEIDARRELAHKLRDPIISNSVPDCSVLLAATKEIFTKFQELHQNEDGTNIFSSGPSC